MREGEKDLKGQKGQKDWLKISTGILALGFAIYCIVLFLLVWRDSDGISGTIFMILALIYTIIYLIYGASLLFIKKDSNFHYLPFVIVFAISFWSSGMPWYVWPFIIVPFIILAFAIFMVLRDLKFMFGRD